MLTMPAGKVDEVRRSRFLSSPSRRCVDMTPSLMIAGEELETLLQLFPYLEKAKERDGMIGITANNVPQEVMVPFLRALMRTEARLLREDADSIYDDGWEKRTPEQRRADAFVDLVVTISSTQKYIGSNDAG
jgi:hypothetical protein